MKSEPSLPSRPARRLPRAHPAPLGGSLLASLSGQGPGNPILISSPRDFWDSVITKIISA